MPRTQPVGGGAKKVLYTLNTVRRMGVQKAAKALGGHNTCKACGLGMGGQRGGMTDELGDFPAVCNKSVQAQSSDVQPAIPVEIFQHALADLQELDGYELEHLGRLNTPLWKAKDSDRYVLLDWGEAIELAADRFAATDPARSFFYSSGRSSNEAGFVLQLLARLYGTNNVNNCSYYCHQATGVGLAGTIGTGTSTVELADLTGSDLIFVIGANPASNHPRFIHKLLDCRQRGGHVVVVNPAREPGLVKFAVPRKASSMLKGGDDIASHYVQPCIGGDIALLTGIAKAVLEQGNEDTAFLQAHTNGFGEFVKLLAAQDWGQLEQASGVSRQEMENIARLYGAAEHAVFAWGMGITHHLHGVANVEAISNLALLRGMVGKRSAGLLPLRGHSNVQGIGTIGVKPVLEEDILRQMEQTLDVVLPRTPGMDTMACMQAADRGEMDAALLMGGNLFGANPDQAFARRALNKVGFKLFLTTTLNRGHVCGVEDGENLILPVTARDEERQPTTQESMFNYVRLSDGGINRLDNVRPEADILCDLALRLLPDSPVDFQTFRQHRTIREAVAKIIPGLQDLASIDGTKREFHVRNRILHTPSFKTEDGKAHFKCVDVPTIDKAPFVLTTVRSEGQFNTIVYEQKDSYRGTNTRWCVLMNGEDMADLEVDEGGKVTLTSDHGQMTHVQVFAFGLRRGNAMAYFPEANVLAGTAVDPRSKTPAFKSIPIRIEKETGA